MQKEPTQRNKLELIGQLTASLVHEVRNSLSALKMNLDYLEMMSSELPEDANESVRLSNEATERISELVSNLLKFSKKDNDTTITESVIDLTNEALKLVQFKAKNRGVNISYTHTNNLPFISITKNKYFQIFVNIVTNAIEACDGGGEVLVSNYLEENTGLIVCAVKDNGVGIADNDKEKIFTEFYTNKNDGTGLGLHVCQVIADEFDAKIDFTSQVGVGTEFFIKFQPVDGVE